MSPPISSAVKDRVIQLSKEGVYRDNIVKMLGTQGIRISAGSVSNIWKAYREQQQQRHDDSTAATLSSGGVFSGEKTGTEDTTANINSQPIASSPPPEVKAIPQKAVSDSIQQKEDTAAAGIPTEEDTITTVVAEDSEMQTDQIQEWDNSRLLQAIKADKQQRHEELLRIQQEKAELLELRRTQQEFYKVKQEFESRYHYAMPLMPMAEQLLRLGVDVDQVLAWKEAIHQCVESENIDLREAAYKVAQDLGFYRQFGGVRKVIE
jgi:hypothetical protein